MKQQKNRPSLGGRLSAQRIAELIGDLPNVQRPEQVIRAVIQLQATVALQGKLIQDLSRAVTHTQQQLYLIKQQENKA